MKRRLLGLTAICVLGGLLQLNSETCCRPVEFDSTERIAFNRTKPPSPPKPDGDKKKPKFAPQLPG